MSRNYTADQAAPARSWRAVTPSNTDDLPAGCRGLFITTGGNVALVGDDDVVATFAGVTDATFMPVGPKRVNSTGTSATGIIALY